MKRSNWNTTFHIEATELLLREAMLCEVCVVYAGLRTAETLTELTVFGRIRKGKQIAEHR